MDVPVWLTVGQVYAEQSRGNNGQRTEDRRISGASRRDWIAAALAMNTGGGTVMAKRAAARRVKER